MVISNQFQVLTREKLSFCPPESFSESCRYPDEESRKRVLFSKVIPQFSRENTIPVLKRLPDIDRVSKLMSSWIDNSI